MDHMIIRTVCLPVFQQKNACIVGLSTPSGQDTSCTKFFNTKDKETGRTIFLIVRIGKPCDKCRAKRVLCIHNEHATGEGLSRKKRSVLQNFFEGDEQSAMQEFQGEAADNGSPIFLPVYVERLLKRPGYPTPPLVDMIMVSIDPAKGGSCEWGLTACYYDTIECVQVILQLDNQVLKDISSASKQKWLETAIQNIRLIDQRFTSIPILIACEADSDIGDQLAEQLQHLIVKGVLYNTHMMREYGNDRPGVLKDKFVTQDMSRYTQMLLENGQVFFSEQYTTSVLGRTREDARRDFFKQMPNWRKRKIVTQTGSFTIRIDGKVGGQNDDLMVSYVMNFYWYLQFMASTKTCYDPIKAQSAHWRHRHVTIEHFRYAHQRRHITEEDEDATVVLEQHNGGLAKRGRSSLASSTSSSLPESSAKRPRLLTNSSLIV